MIKYYRKERKEKKKVMTKAKNTKDRKNPGRKDRMK